MSDTEKTKEQLLGELAPLRARVAELEELEIERKQTEASLRESERKYRLLADNATDVIWTMDMEQRLTFFSPSVEKLRGYTPAEAMKVPLEKTLTSESYMRAVQIIMEELSREEEPGVPPDRSRTLELEQIRKDGSTFWTEVTTSFLRDEGGVPTGIVGITRDITERKRVEEELKNSEARFRDISENIADWIWEVDAEGKYTFASGKVESILGYSAEELLGKTPFDFMAPEEVQRVGSLFAEIVSNKQIILDLENWNIAKDGRRVCLLTNGIPLLDKSGELLGYRGVDSDITQRKQAEENLRKSEKWNRVLFDTSPDAMFLIDKQKRIKDVNNTAVNRYGYTREELLSMRVDELSAPSLRKKVSARVQETFELTASFQWVHCRKDGSELDVEINSSRIDHGDQIRILSSARDITERKLAEGRAVGLSKIFESSLNEIYVFDEKTLKFLEVNRGARENLGYTADELYKMTPLDIKPEITPEAFFKEIAPLRNGEKELVRFETVHQRKDGALYNVEVNVQLSSNWAPPAFVAIILDITDRKRAEQEKAKLEQQLGQAQKMEAVGRLAGGVAHDFNNILTAIQGFSEFVYDGLSEGDPLRRDVMNIRKASESAGLLTQQLLAFSRKQVIAPRAVDLNESFEASKRMLQRLIGEDIDLAFGGGKDLWTVKVDPGQIDQILVNLAVNARDAMPAGGRLTIETSNVTLDDKTPFYGEESPRGEFVLVAVSDAGTGMSSETRRRIFEPFYTTKEQGKGTGLGLSTVYGILKQNRGYIDVISEVNVGTTFKIYIPRFEGKSEDRIEEPPPSDTFATETVLLVEDQELVRKLAQRVLARKGYKVLEALDGEKALEICEDYRGSIDLLLTDVVMPKMNGKQLYDKISKAMPGLQVLYMSGYTDNEIAHHGVLEPGVNFLQKPFRPDALIRAVRQAIDA
jgi:two-component system, cell cycle sensor histidine kinase and response regulator CckA